MLKILLFFIYFLKNYRCEPEVLTPGDETLPTRGFHDAMFAPVFFPCNECAKLIDKYVFESQKSEILGVKVKTFLAFCESWALDQDPKYNSSTHKYCLDLHSRLLDNHQQIGVNKADYDPYEKDLPDKFFLNYRLSCEKFEGLSSTQCYTGFCEKYLECIDCPFGFNLVDNQYNYELQVCSGHGVCRLGWLNDRGKKGGNGFCECYEGRKGLACDQISGGERVFELPKNTIKIKKTPGADQEWLDKLNLQASENLSERKKLMSEAQETQMEGDKLINSNEERFLF